MKHLKINSSTFAVKYLNELTDAETNRELMGQADYTKKVIRIWNQMPKESKQQTLLHEALHVIEREYGIKLSESKLEVLANALYAFMIDNKSFIRGVVK